MYKKPGDFNCETCTEKNCDVDRTRPGSRGPAGFPRWEVKDDNGNIVIQSEVCLLPMITEQTHYLIGLHKHYMNGVLPFSGGLLEQPNLYIEAMGLL